MLISATVRALLCTVIYLLREAETVEEIPQPTEVHTQRAGPAPGYGYGSCPNHFAEFFHQISKRNGLPLSDHAKSDSEQHEWLSTSFQLFDLGNWLRNLKKTDTIETQEEAVPQPRFECRPNPAAKNRSGKVNLVNNTELLRLIVERPNASESENETSLNNTSDGVKKKSGDNVCVVVMFYATSCRFSAATAPEFNALGRAITGVDVLAYDINQSSGVNSRYSIVAVPSIALFQNGKLVARFNESQRTLGKMLGFIHNLTGLEVNTAVSVSAEDYEGPVATTPVIGPDYFLWFSNAFLFLCALGFMQQKVGAAVRAKLSAVRDYVTQVWRTGEFYEQVGIADEHGQHGQRVE